MSSKGKLFLILNGHQYVKRNTFKNRIYWACTQRTALNCQARVTQDTETNRLEATDKILHNHDFVNARRKVGELKALRAKYGLPPDSKRNTFN